ncbi:unnamed protein product [Hymenolepis diminuta]|uniref:Uncharacterized protein n=1 Tax=Hymenolepis diminuta TaxID=6216 RepID=A0A564Y587_HYMDI|nr:unnamed protein product [Hymenolepis diminuta]
MAWHGMMDENREKSMRDILSNILECLKEEQYMGSVLHQRLISRLISRRRSRQLMWTKPTRENCLLCAKGLLKKLKSLRV